MNARHILAIGIVAVVSAQTAFAGSATWLASPPTGDWNTATNWSPATVPNGPADVATFGSTDQIFVALSANTEVGGIVFNPATYPYSIRSNGFTLTISGAGMVNNSGNVNFLIASGATSVIRFQGSSTAGTSNMGIVSQSDGRVLFTGS